MGTKVYIDLNKVHKLGKNVTLHLMIFDHELYMQYTVISKTSHNQPPSIENFGPLVIKNPNQLKYRLDAMLHLGYLVTLDAAFINAFKEEYALTMELKEYREYIYLLTSIAQRTYKPQQQDVY